MKSRIGSLLESLELAKTVGNGCVLSKFDVIELLGHIDELKEDSVLSGLFPPGEMTPPDGGPMCTRPADPSNDSEYWKTQVQETYILLRDAHAAIENLRNLLVEVVRTGKDVKREAISQDPFSDEIGMNMMDSFSIAIDDAEEYLLNYEANMKRLQTAWMKILAR